MAPSGFRRYWRSVWSPVVWEGACGVERDEAIERARAWLLGQDRVALLVRLKLGVRERSGSCCEAMVRRGLWWYPFPRLRVKARGRSGASEARVRIEVGFGMHERVGVLYMPAGCALVAQYLLIAYAFSVGLSWTAVGEAAMVMAVGLGMGGVVLLLEWASHEVHGRSYRELYELAAGVRAALSGAVEGMEEG